MTCSTSPAAGYYICADDWQGESLADCTFVEGKPPLQGVMVYYESGGSGLKPYWAR